EPIIIREPCTRCRQSDEVTRPCVVQAIGFLFLIAPDFSNPRGCFENSSHLVRQRKIVQIHMGNLVVGNGEYATRATIKEFASEFVFDGKPAALAEEAVQMDGRVYGADAVFRQNERDNMPFLEEVQKATNDLVDQPQVLGDVR